MMIYTGYGLNYKALEFQIITYYETRTQGKLEACAILYLVILDKLFLKSLETMWSYLIKWLSCTLFIARVMGSNPIGIIVYFSK